MILMTGATGLLGPRLHAELVQRDRVTRVARNSVGEDLIRCDLTDVAALRGVLDRSRPDLIVHVAALADVDACERSPRAAYTLNVNATQTLVDWCAAESSKTRFVYISTDQVYDGPGPHAEADVSPGNVYALTKLWGEDHARRISSHTVLRVNFFTGPRIDDRGLVPWLIRQAGSDKPVLLFTDVLFSPLHVDHLAALVGEVIDQDITGTFNLGSSGPGVSKAEFLRSVARRLDLPDANFQDGSVDAAGLLAYRPRDMRMDVRKAERALQRQLPTVADGIDLLISQFQS